MNEDLVYLFSFSALVPLCISCIIYIVSRAKQIKVFKYLGYYLFLNLMTEFFAWLFQMLGENNLPLLHIYTLGEFILFSLFYQFLFKDKIDKPKLFNLFIIIISVIIIFNSIFLQSIYGFNSYAKSLVQCILIGYSLYYFIGIDAKIEKRNQVEKSRLIANTAILIYYSGSLFVFMFSDFFLRYGNKISFDFWMFNIILNLIFQIIILVALWKVFRNKKSIS